MTLTRRSGEAVPFGATVSINHEQDNSQANIVGDRGQAFLSGLPEEGELQVTWGADTNASCHATSRLDPTKNLNGIVTANAVCQ